MRAALLLLLDKMANCLSSTEQQLFIVLVYSYLQLHSTATEAEKVISFKNNRTTTALLALFAVEEQVKLFVAK